MSDQTKTVSGQNLVADKEIRIRVWLSGGIGFRMFDGSGYHVAEVIVRAVSVRHDQDQAAIANEIAEELANLWNAAP